MLTGPPPKFHGTWDILNTSPANRYRDQLDYQTGP